jgi:outer membrane lipoprotein SlyB
MMSTVIAVAMLLLSVGSAWAQAGAELRGRIEEIRDGELLVRSDDGRLHIVDTAAIRSVELGTLNPGDTVVIATKGEGVRGPIGRAVQRRTPAPPVR